MFDKKEGNLSMLAIQWAMAHKDYWKDSEFIYIEWQFSKDQSKRKDDRENERACLLIKTVLESFFLTLYLRGEGPKPICEVATWWKRRVGVEIGGSDHDGNKKRAIEVFREHPETGGEAAINALKNKFGHKIDDAVEASLMCIALKEEIGELRRRENKFYSKHSHHAGKKRFKEEDRWLPLLIETETDPMKHRPAYLEFKKQRAEEKKKRGLKRSFENI